VTQFTVYWNKNRALGSPEGSLAERRDRIVGAMDFLLSGF
jgi:hypothetical protein